MVRRGYFAFLIALLSLLTGIGSWQEQPAAAQGTLKESGIRVNARQSLVVTVPANVREVTSEDDQIAEAILVNSGDPQRAQVLIHGRTPGSTRLILWTGQTGQPMAVTVAAAQETAPAAALQLVVNGFRIIKVAGVLRRVAVGDEAVAGVMVLPAEKPEDHSVSLLIDGRSPGVTNVLIWTGRQVDSLKVAVR